LVLQGLCCLDVQGDRAGDLVDAFLAESKDDAETIELARTLLAEILAERVACDDILTRHARHWQLGRLALVDRNILRLGVYELRSLAAPAAVIISEAIKLAREFSTAESPRFVNGVLDAVAHDVSADLGEAEARNEGD
jgi:N utilization substance protein B